LAEDKLHYYGQQEAFDRNTEWLKIKCSVPDKMQFLDNRQRFLTKISEFKGEKFSSLEKLTKKFK